MYWVWFTTLLHAGTSIGQSQTPISTANQAFVYTPTPACDGCYLAAGTAPPNLSSASGFSSLDTGQTGSLAGSYVLFTAYSITSQYLTNGVCVTTSGMPRSLQSAFSILKPSSVAASDFLLTAESSFIDFLGFASCSGSGERVLPTPLVQLSNGSESANISSASASTTSPSSLQSLPTPSTALTTSLISPKHPHLDRQAEISVGIVIPVAVIALLSLGFLLWRRSSRKGKSSIIRGKDEPLDGDQPYLQRKAELEAEEKGKHELEGRGRRYELDGESNIHEIAGGEDDRGMPSLQVRQELQGEEHSRELGFP